MLWPQLAAFRFSCPDESFITAYPEPDTPLEIVWDTYRRSVLPMAMQVAGLEALHASAIVSAGGVVVFCAVSETGKSTVAYGLRRRGFPQWADDGVVIRRATSFETIPLPFQARLRPGSHELLGHERPEYFRYTHNEPGEQTFTEPAPIRAICMLHRDEHLEAGTPARIAPMPLSSAFTAALTHAHEFDPSDAERRAEMVQTYLRLVAEIPTFDVTFRPDRRSIDADETDEVATRLLRIGHDPRCAPGELHRRAEHLQSDAGHPRCGDAAIGKHQQDEVVAGHDRPARFQVSQKMTLAMIDDVNDVGVQVANEARIDDVAPRVRIDLRPHG